MNGILLALCISCRASVPIPPDAMRAVGILEDGRRKVLVPGEYELSESEINSAVSYYVAKDKEASRWVRSASVKLKDGKLFDVDVNAGFGPELLEKVDAQAKGFVVTTLSKLLRSENSVHVECFFTSAKGKGFFQVRKAKLNGLPLPESIVQKVLDLAGPRIKPPVDFHTLFKLQNGVEKVEILPGRVRFKVRAL